MLLHDWDQWPVDAEEAVPADPFRRTAGERMKRSSEIDIDQSGLKMMLGS